MWEGYLSALASDPSGVAHVLNTRLKATPFRRAELPELQVELAWCIEIESAWQPDIVNPKSNATGLIQFMPKTAIKLGTTVQELRKMTRTEQSVYVQKYFDMVNLTCRQVGDIYLLMAGPVGLGKPDDFVIYPVGSAAWKDNPGLREPNDGPITSGSVRRRGTPPTQGLPGIPGPSSKPLPTPPKKPTPKPKPLPKSWAFNPAAVAMLGLLWWINKKRKKR